MTDASNNEFRESGTGFFRRVTTAVFGVGTVVLIGMIFKLGPDDYLMIIPIGLIALLMVLGIILVTRELGKPRVCLDASAIRGYTSAGKESLIAWGEPVSVQRPRAADIVVRPAGGRPSESLVIPVKIAMSLEFRTAMEKFASPEHPLRKWVMDETAGRNPAPYKPSAVPTIVGFGGGLAALLSLTKVSGKLIYIQPTATLLPFMMVFGVFTLGTLLNKQILGDRWSNRQWFQRIMTTVMNFAFGSVMSIIVFDLFVVLIHTK